MNQVKRVGKVRLAATLLLGLSLLGSMTLNAAGITADERQNVRVLTPLVEDANTGYEVFMLSEETEASHERRIVMQDPDGAWSVLHERFGQIMPFDIYHGSGDRDPEYQVWIKDRPGGYIAQQFYYNFEDQAVYDGLSYTWSPNRKAGYSLVKTPRPIEAGVPYYDWLDRSLMVKDAETGDIHEWMRFETRRFQLYWLDDERLFISHYNTKAKQNELLLLNVQSGERTHYAYGTALAQDTASGEILFVRNEPTRTRLIYDVRSGKERKATEAEIRRFMPAPVAAQEDTLTQLDWRSLPIADPPVVARHEHQIIVDGTVIELPYAFRRDGTLYIPVSPLLSGLGLQMEDRLGTAARYRIPIKSISGRVELRPNDNSLILGDRLYTTQGVLQSLGFKSIRVEANVRSEQS